MCSSAFEVLTKRRGKGWLVRVGCSDDLAADFKGSCFKILDEVLDLSSALEVEGILRDC